MPNVYDELPYPGLPFSQTHPDRLATTATLLGMTPAAVDGCRVLELGCGEAGNLIPMAFTLPRSCFTGIDLSGTAIARGHDLVNELRLPNIRLEQLDLRDFDSRFGQFDYIIAHGVYSWVPPDAREQVLDICKTHLAQNGVTYISYNTYPGGHLRDAIRSMMQFHVAGVAGAVEKSTRVRELLEFLVEASPAQDAYHAALQSELQSFLGRNPAHFFHDELNEFNYRFYFYEFVKDAGRHGLQYVSEAHPFSSLSATLPPAVTEKMRAFSPDDNIVREQYADFVTLRKFRQSLLCHDAVQFERRLDPSRVSQMLIVSEVQPAAAQPVIPVPSAEEFRYPKGGSISTNHPLGKAALLHLGRIWPAPIAFSDLLHTARDLAECRNAPLADDSAWLCDMLLKLYAARLAELHLHVPACPTSPSAKPLVSPLVRAQLRTSHSVTNLRHAAVSIDDEGSRFLLTLLDGTRDRTDLLAEMRRPFDGITAEQLETNLERLAKMSLLVA